MRHALEQIPEDAVRILHPLCGGVVCLTRLACYDGRLEAEAICYRCDKYVRLELKTSLLPDNHSPELLNLRAVRQQTILRAWEKADHNAAKAARMLGVARSSLYTCLREIGVTYGSSSGSASSHGAGSHES